MTLPLVVFHAKGGAAVSSETKLLPQLKSFLAALGDQAALPQLPVSNSRRFVCALPLRQLRAASVCASCGGLGMDAEDLKEVQRRPARTRK